MFPFLSDLLRWFGQGLPTPPFGRPEVSRRRADGRGLVRRGSPGPAIRLSGSLHVTRQRSGAGRAAVAEDGGVRRPLPKPATGRDCSSSTTSVNHRGPPSMSRRVGYQRTQQMSRKKSRKVRETRSLYSRKRPERGQKCRQRLELGIHGLNRWAVNCLEMSRKRGVQTDRNGPSPPSCVAKAEMSTADRLGSREGSSRAGWREPVGVCVEPAMTHRSASRCVFATHPTCWRPGNVVCPQRSPGTCSPAPRPLPSAENWLRFPARFRPYSF
jgi:hypothetical protein